MTLSRRAALLLPALLSLPARAQAAWPVKPVRFIVPYPPGGGSDVVARILLQVMNELPGAPFCVVDNRGGAGGNIGAEILAHSPPDGATLGIISIGTHGTNPTLFPRQGFDPINDFTPVAQISAQPVAIAARAESDIRSLDDLLQQRRELTFGTSGTGTSGHLAGEVLRVRSGLQMVHVPFRGSGPEWADLLGGRIDLAVDNVPIALPHQQAGRVRILALTGKQRSPVLPEVPVLAEKLPDSVVYSWNGIAGPAGLPEPLIRQLAGVIRTALQSPVVQARYAELAIEIPEADPVAFAAFIRHEIEFWRHIITEAKITLD